MKRYEKEKKRAWLGLFSPPHGFTAWKNKFFLVYF